MISEEEDGFFSSIRNIFTGDKEEEPYYPPTRSSSGYRDNYRDDYRQPASDRYDRYDNYDNYEDNYYNQGNAAPPPRYRNSAAESRESSRSSNRGRPPRSRNMPYENDWDEEDDEWF